uniref:uncharacterized protein LOC101301153 n=1 Tax=Fragaria vesca subsp. vesca TaxID=101020 RepID=UPI0005C9974C|nr:PREDICTED: uncharacterized protein LOC101301153 [Fragaria vesca subsp. vesca]
MKMNSASEALTIKETKKKKKKWLHWEVQDSPPATIPAAALLHVLAACLAGAQPGLTLRLRRTTRNAHVGRIVAATRAVVLAKSSPLGLARPTASAATLATVSHALLKEAQQHLHCWDVNYHVIKLLIDFTWSVF